MEMLSSKIIEKRDQLLDKFDHLSLEELSIKIKEFLISETDELSKIAFLAARVSIVNRRLLLILNAEFINDNTIDNTIDNNVKNSENMIETIIDNKKPNNAEKAFEWVRVQIKETTEVNGVRFPAGIQIDVTLEDSKKIIDSGKALLIDSGEST
jgi:deoxycytidine triphosphate deaminase